MVMFAIFLCLRHHAKQRTNIKWILLVFLNLIYRVSTNEYQMDSTRFFESNL